MTARIWPISIGAAVLIFSALLFSSQLALAQTITEFPTPTVRSQPSGITTGPDGALWFTEGDQVGRLIPDGTSTLKLLPGAFAQPLGITAGWLFYLGHHAVHEEWKRRGAVPATGHHEQEQRPNEQQANQCQRLAASTES